MNIYEQLRKAEKAGRPWALATIVKTYGHTPRSAGTKMLVYENGSIDGTVGGGEAEARVIADALDCMRTGQTLLKRYAPQAPAGGGQADGCEKVIEVFIEPGKTEPDLYLLGSGHVARAVMLLARQAGFRVTVIDTWDTSPVGAALQEADARIHLESFAKIDPALVQPQGYYIICTPSHAADCEALQGVLPLDAAYIGMLGAKHKFLPIFEKMRELGYPDEQLKEIHAPVGLDIGGETLPELAVSIVGELIAVRNGKDGGFLREKKRKELFPEG